MPVLTKKGVFTANTSTGNQAVTGVGFQPVAVLFMVTRQTAAGTVETASALGIGAGVSSTKRFAVASAGDDAVTTTNVGRRVSATKCILILASGAPTVDGEADFVSMDSDGFTINWTDAPAGAYQIHYYAIGGSDITAADAGTFTGSGSTGAQAITAPGFRPDFLMLAAPGVTSADANSTTFNVAIGMTSGPGEDATANIALRDAQATSQSNKALEAGRVFRLLSASTGGSSFVADLTSFDANGFTLDWITTAGTQVMVYLALQGGQHKVGTDTQKTSTGTKATTGLGFQPDGLFAFHVNRVVDTAADTTSGIMGIGASDGATDGHVWARSRDGVTTTEESMRTSTSALIESTGETGTTALAVAEVSSFDSDGFTLDWTTADATAREFAYWAIGERLPLNTATETDTALPLGAATKSKALGIATETDTAVALPPRVGPLGVATETDTALPLGAATKSKAVNLATETDTAQPLGRSKSKAIAVATETDTALPLGAATKSKALGIATETDTAVALPPIDALPIGVALETDTALPLGAATKSKALGIATETDAAIPLSVTPPDSVSIPVYMVEVAWAPGLSDAFTFGESTFGGGDGLGGSFLTNFDGPYDDVSLDTEEFVIRRGRDDPLTEVQAGTCELTLFDLDGLYNPLNTSSPLYGQMIPMRQVRVTASVAGTDYVLFRGFVRTMDHDPITRRTKVLAEDALLYFSRTRPIVPEQAGTTGALINEVILASNWTDESLTDVDVTRGDDVDAFSLAGTSDSRTALQGVFDLLESERGLFYVARDGVITYEDRYTQALKPSSATLTDVFTNVLPGVALEQVINRARITKEGGVQQEATDSASILLYGPGDLSIESPYFEDDAQAAALANYLVWRFASPAAPVWAVPLVGNIDEATMIEVLSREIGDRVTLTSTQTGVSGDYYVESISHRVRSATYHESEWSLSRREEPGELFSFGSSTFGGGDILAYY